MIDAGHARNARHFRLGPPLRQPGAAFRIAPASRPMGNPDRESAVLPHSGSNRQTDCAPNLLRGMQTLHGLDLVVETELSRQVGARNHPRPTVPSFMALSTYPRNRRPRSA